MEREVRLELTNVGVQIVRRSAEQKRRYYEGRRIMFAAMRDGSWYTAEGPSIELRGEQPDEAIHSLPGALRGDVPLSETEGTEV